ncbi:MAG: hypothetical protein ACFB4I_20420 [Cyanophyceae cyanobacterium]
MPWQPRNKYCWDSWYYRQGNTLHAFYLQASQFACVYLPEKRHGLASIGHAVLTDFGWKEINPDKSALERREGDHWDNLVTWTGSIYEENGLYYLFYTGKRIEDTPVETPQERRRPQNIGVATSSDLIHWTRTPATEAGPVIPHPDANSKFDGSNWRDPWVIKDAVDEKYYAFICARPSDSPPDRGGLIAYATSDDLEHWQEEPYRVLYRSDEHYLLETPQVFWRRMNDGQWRCYLIFGPHWSPFFTQKIPIGVTLYVRSRPIADRSQLQYDRIPWEEEPANILCNYLYAGKLVDLEATYPLFYGFQKEDESGRFVGGISDPLWAGFTADGHIELVDFKPN